jgi:tRNA threonylcarbamoyladenosine biosynthesis protein TsaE
MTEPRGVVFAGTDEAGLATVARALAPKVAVGGTIYLVGELGAGKTTFARALLIALGVGARVKSPTYSLIESYAVGDLAIQHLDLYRIAVADEVEWLGLRDLAVGRHLWLIEWPERAAAALPAPDLVVHLAHAVRGRDVRLDAVSAIGRTWLDGCDFVDSGPASTAS